MGDSNVTKGSMMPQKEEGNVNRYLIAIVALVIALLGCGGGSASETNAHGGTGGATTSGGQGGGGQGGQVPCEEPTPEGWLGPFQPYAAAISDNNALTVLPDESGGLAGVGPKIGPFACAHDFVQVGVSYRTQPLFGYDFMRPAAVKLDLVMGDADGNPAYAPTFAEAACHTDGTEPKCGPLALENDYAMTYIEIVPIHVEPGDVLYPTVQLDDNIGVSTSEPLSPNPGWYYAPPGSAAGGEMGLWAALDDPPPGVPPYHFAPAIRLYE